MQEQDREPIGTSCLMAALADGFRSPEEQALLRRISAQVGPLPALSGDASLDGVAGRLSPGSPQLAYELAVSVVYADGHANERERDFLASLRTALELGADGARSLEDDAVALTDAPLAARVPPEPVTQKGLPKSLLASQGGIPTISPDAALDNLIKKQAMLTGALELLPQTIATLAIIPIQMRLVYRIGADYGHGVDADQIRDLLGAMGIGAAVQVLDGMTRRILTGLGRGLAGSALGGVVGGTAAAALGAGLSFVTTYALGHAAKQYYAQSRHLSREDLVALFRRFK